MAEQQFKDYPIPSRDQLDENSSFLKMLNLVGRHKKVVDVGCATGYFSKLLVDEGCDVVGIEINPDAAKVAEQYCRQVIVADLDQQDIQEVLGSEQFEVAIFGDVLEHLKDPWSTLKSVRKILAADGYVVASIPNIAHGAIRLALLEGRFEYAELGLLDDTHLRFFTRETVHQLFEETGYCIEAEDHTNLPVFAPSALVPEVDKERFPPAVLERILNDQNSDILQFVVRAYPWSLSREYGALKRNHEKAQAALSQTRLDLQQAEQSLQSCQAELVQTQAELAHTQAELAQTQTLLIQTQGECTQAQKGLHETQAELGHTQQQLYELTQEAELLRNRIRAMASSKFWQLRNAWFRLKRAIGLKDT
jgi:2-polyprenyl-3-methyl-5-hydroxy-6-metoxy-1,4-benzoquinol methylase